MQEDQSCPTSAQYHKSFRGTALSALKKPSSLPITPLTDGALVQFDPTTRYVTTGASGGSFSNRLPHQTFRVLLFTHNVSVWRRHTPFDSQCAQMGSAAPDSTRQQCIHCCLLFIIFSGQ
eukprot:sb/3476247/